MAKKTPKKDINLYLLVAGPKKSTMKKGLLFTVLGIAAVVLMAVGFTSLKVYQSTQEKLVAELEEKTQDPALLEKIEHVNELAKDIATIRTAGDAYGAVRGEIDYGIRSSCDNFTLDLIDKLIHCQDYRIGSEMEQIAAITAVSYDGQTLHISATSPDSQYVSSFVYNLTRLNIFSDVSYSSYTRSEVEDENGEVTVSYAYTIDAVFVTHEYNDAEENPEATGEGETTDDTTTGTEEVAAQ